MFTPEPHDIRHPPEDADFAGHQAVGSDPQEADTLGRLNGTPVVFWQELNAVEREAFRSFAYPRSFAAGARLIQEGDRTDHVFVILSGSTEIRIEKYGVERAVAIRGPGQLVGERAALQISVRSASVVAVDTVHALVAQIRDFAAFISGHPRVLGMIERQAHNRYGADALGSDPGGPVTTGRPVQPWVLAGENCTVMLSDVAGFGADWRNDEDRRIIREALFSMTHTVLGDLPDEWSWDDRGDGLLTVVLPTVPTARVVAHLHKELQAALDEHNRVCPDSARIQLRVAINVGPVTSDRMGVSGEAIIVAARLVEAPAFKDAMNESGASLGIIASPFIYNSVIRHGPYLEGYSKIPVQVKELRTAAWIKLFDRPLSCGEEA
jgi:Cyclic nucleotide-binding domain